MDRLRPFTPARPLSADPPVRALAEDTRFVLLVTLAALGLRIAYYLLLGPIDWPDTGTYLRAGRDLLAGRTIGSDIVMPLYPPMLVATGWRGVIWVQLLLSALLVPLVYRLAHAVLAGSVLIRPALDLLAPALMLVFGSAVHVAMQAVVRYRTPLMPFIVVIAAAGWQRATERTAGAIEARRA